VSKKLKARGVEVVYEDDGDKENGVYQIINPTCTQCVWIHPEDSTEKKRLQQVDYFQIISENDKEEDELDADIDRRMLQFTANQKAATGPEIDLIPLLLEIYGDKLEVGEEALPLMSPDGFRDWLWLLFASPTPYEPQVIKETEAA